MAGLIWVNDQEFPWSEGLTVKELLKQKNYTFPAIIVAINGIQAPEEEFSGKIIADGDNVRVIHLVAGG